MGDDDGAFGSLSALCRTVRALIPHLLKTLLLPQELHQLQFSIIGLPLCHDLPSLETQAEAKVPSSSSTLSSAHVD